MPGLLERYEKLYCFPFFVSFLSNDAHLTNMGFYRGYIWSPKFSDDIICVAYFVWIAYCNISLIRLAVSNAVLVRMLYLLYATMYHIAA